MECKSCNDNMRVIDSYKDGNKRIKVYKCGSCGMVHEDEVR